MFNCEWKRNMSTNKSKECSGEPYRTINELWFYTRSAQSRERKILRASHRCDSQSAVRFARSASLRLLFLVELFRILVIVPKFEYCRRILCSTLVVDLENTCDQPLMIILYIYKNRKRKLVMYDHIVIRRYKSLNIC